VISIAAGVGFSLVTRGGLVMALARRPTMRPRRFAADDSEDPAHGRV